MTVRMSVRNLGMTIPRSLEPTRVRLGANRSSYDAERCRRQDGYEDGKQSARAWNRKRAKASSSGETGRRTTTARRRAHNHHWVIARRTDRQARVPAKFAVRTASSPTRPKTQSGRGGRPLALERHGHLATAQGAAGAHRGRERRSGLSETCVYETKTALLGAVFRGPVGHKPQSRLPRREVER